MMNTGIGIFFSISMLWVLLAWTINHWRHERDISAPAAYLYLASLISLAAMAVGLTQTLEILLGQVLFDNGETIAGSENLRTLLVPPMAMVIVATPLWALHWSIIQRRLRNDPNERQSFLRTLYLYLTATIAAIASLFLLQNNISYIFLAIANESNLSAPGIFGTVVISSLVTAGRLIPPLAIWYTHLRPAMLGQVSAPGAGVPKRFHFYVLAVLSLFMAAEGAQATATASLEAVVMTGAILHESPDLTTSRHVPALASLLVGTIFFLWHWRNISKDRLSRSHLAYFLFIGAAGIIGAVTSGVWIGHEIIGFLLGQREPNQWVFLTDAIPLFLISSSIFLLHRPFLLAATNTDTTDALIGRRLTLYILNATGLGVAGIAIANLIRILLEHYAANFEDLGRSSDWWRDQTSLFVMLVLVGLPIWMLTRNRLRSVVDTRNPVEIRMWPRRLHVYGTLIVVLVIALTNAIGVIRPILGIALGDIYSPSIAAGLYTSLANTAIAATIFWHFARTASEDRAAVKATLASTTPQVSTETKPEIIAIVSPSAVSTIQSLETTLNTPINLLGILNADHNGTPAEPSQQQLDTLLDDIGSSRSPHILLLLSPPRLEVIPYE